MHIDWKELVSIIAPLVLSKTKLAPIVPYIAPAIAEAEGLILPGPQKLNHAVNAAQLAFAAVNAQKGHTVINTDLTATAIAKGISAVVDATNAVHKPSL